jgi:hypothetical protein
MGEAPKEIVVGLRAAVAAVEEAKIPKDLRVAAFTAALAGLPNSPLPSSGEGGGNRPATHTDHGGTHGSEGVKAIAGKLEVGEAQAAAVYDVDEDGVHLTVKRAALDKTKKVAQQEVTYLVTAGRQAAGIEEWTPVKIVIEATHDRGVHDTNVSKAISALDGDGIRFRGTGGSREIKMNAVGFSNAAEIVKRLAEAS